MPSIFKKVLSMEFGTALLLIFAASCAVATFIENDFGTESAFALIYASSWFAFIQILLVIIVLYNLYKYNLFKLEKLPSLLFHLSFLFILVGSGLTRYIGFEGIIHIREGQKQNIVNSSDPYIELKTIKNSQTYSASKKKLFSLIGSNSFDLNLDFDGEKANFTYKKIVANAAERLVETKDDKPIISLMLGKKNNRPNEINLNINEQEQINNFHVYFSDKNIDFSDKNKIYFQVSLEGGKFYFTSNKSISFYKMSDNTKGTLAPFTKNVFLLKHIYSIDDINIVPKALFQSGKKDFVSQHEGQNLNLGNVIVGTLTYNGESKEISLRSFGGTNAGVEKSVTLAGREFTLFWGSKLYKLPFWLELMDFQLERYPGSHSPSSYASEIRLIDETKQIDLPYRIYMNHVLDYSGFRFFQSSYDRDEKGTILSVNKDPGKLPTYIGYTMLFLGLILNLLNPKSRFRSLANSINKTSMAKLGLLMTLLLPLTDLKAYDLPSYDKSHAKLFGTMLVQSMDGRIKPIDTLSNEVLTKVYKKRFLEGQNPNQVILGMLTNPHLWQKVPMIKVHEKEVKKLLNMDENAKYATFEDFFDEQQSYKLIKQIEEAKRKKPASRDRFDKDIIKVDERLNICYLIYTGELLRIFPRIDDKMKSWYSPNTALTYFSKEQSTHIQKILIDYFQNIKLGVKTGDYSKANESINTIKSYQKQYANDIIPNEGRINMELKFNKFQIFQKLTPVYLLAGFVLLFAIFFKMLIPSLNLKILNLITLAVIFFAFIAQTIGLGMRWYIAGHAPWSNSYESMIYIAWALALSGVTFSRQSPISLALTSILAGVSLFVAHLTWLDPQITTLAPVLKSYWLTIHVSVITASYGFLGLCSLLGFFTLILFIIINPNKDDKRNHEIKRNIIEATKINEMAMILGLTLLTIGNFLGGIWANESWGRYWGWDAKETWSLISIVIYAAIIHIRFIPKLNNQYTFAVFSMFAYWSIIMTYFGVNFYLSGMHSYAAGDPVPIPAFVPITALIMALIAIMAFFKRTVSKLL